MERPGTVEVRRLFTEFLASRGVPPDKPAMDLFVRLLVRACDDDVSPGEMARQWTEAATKNTSPLGQMQNRMLTMWLTNGEFTGSDKTEGTTSPEHS